jgi:uncharacterized protein YaaN involved in tellurite resistance
MNSIHQDPVTFYKDLERECNKKIHEYTNCLTFTHAFGRAMESHLDDVVTHQKIINDWLTVFDIPTKDDIAALAHRKVDCEESIDHLEETVYTLNKGLIKDNLELKKLNNTLRELYDFLESEMKNVKATKIKTLETEIEELKSLFNN